LLWKRIDAITVALVMLGAFLATFAFVAVPAPLTGFAFGLIMVVEVTTIVSILRMRHWEHDQMRALDRAMELFGERIAMICPFCSEDICAGDREGQPISVDGILRRAHAECGLRSVVGGIGHLTNHDYWCIEHHDPDAGLSYRESARQVFAYWKERGTDDA
jgi:hypothetical protein